MMEMVWKAKTSLAELLKRRGQTLESWMNDFGITSRNALDGWCITNDVDFDVIEERVDTAQPIRVRKSEIILEKKPKVTLSRTDINDPDVSK
jgi:hypothetical protein